MAEVVYGRFVPLMQAARATGLEDILRRHGGTTHSETKRGGYRVQVHHRQGAVRLFGSDGRLLDNDLYPDIIAAVRRTSIDFIADAQLAGMSDGTLGVAEAKRRYRDGKPLPDKAKRAYLESGVIDECPLQAWFFDILRRREEVLVDMPLLLRRGYMGPLYDNERLHLSPTDALYAGFQLRQALHGAIAAGHAGIICKNPRSAYLPGRSQEWLALDAETAAMVTAPRHATRTGSYRRRQRAA